MLKCAFFCSVAKDITKIIEYIRDHVSLLIGFLVKNIAISHFYDRSTIIAFASKPCLRLRVPNTYPFHWIWV